MKDPLRHVKPAVTVGFGFCRLASDPVPMGLMPPCAGGPAVRPPAGSVEMSGNSFEFAPLKPMVDGSKPALVVCVV